MQPAHQQAIVLMTKTPGYLPVKTRVAVDLDHQTALELYKCFLRDIGDKFRRLQLPLLVHHLPGLTDEESVLSELLGPITAFYPQIGHDLGARMQKAFEQHFAQGWEQLILIGGDCPDLPPELFQQAFKALESHDCVLGPTLDGGYYLIGFKRSGFAPSVFDFPDWGAKTVYGETIRRLQTGNVTYFELDTRSDIDTLQELQQVYQHNQQGWFSDSHTLQLLKQLWVQP